MKILFQIRKLLKQISFGLNKLLRRQTIKSIEADNVDLLETEKLEMLEDIYEQATKQENCGLDNRQTTISLTCYL